MEGFSVAAITLGVNADQEEGQGMTLGTSSQRLGGAVLQNDKNWPVAVGWTSYPYLINTYSLLFARHQVVLGVNIAPFFHTFTVWYETNYRPKEKGSSSGCQIPDNGTDITYNTREAC